MTRPIESLLGASTGFDSAARISGGITLETCRKHNFTDTV